MRKKKPRTLKAALKEGIQKVKSIRQKNCLLTEVARLNSCKDS